VRVAAPHSGAEDEDKLATGLRFTDVLFGFVLRELVIRLVDWRVQPVWVRGHLILTAVVVLGSYVGYRNSAKRADDRVRFFNLPLARFALDQMMVFAYFRMAIATQDLDLATNPAASAHWPSPASLARIETAMLGLIAGCYLLWDVLGHVMAWRTDGDGHRRYPTIAADWRRTMMTVGLLAVTVVGVVWSHLARLGSGQAVVLQAVAVAVVLAYRTAKDHVRLAAIPAP